MSNTKINLSHYADEDATWLITGVAGFIDSSLLRALLDNGQRVIGLDNFFSGYQRNLDHIRSLVGDAEWDNFNFIEGDIRDLTTCRKVCVGAASGRSWQLSGPLLRTR